MGPAAPLALVCALPRWRALANRMRAVPQKVLLALALCGFLIHYAVFMVPKYGPLNDLDLFSQTYFVLAFLSGMLLDAAGLAAKTRRRVFIVTTVAGVVSLYFLMTCTMPWWF